MMLARSIFTSAPMTPRLDEQTALALHAQKWVQVIRNVRSEEQAPCVRMTSHTLQQCQGVANPVGSVCRLCLRHKEGVGAHYLRDDPGSVSQEQCEVWEQDSHFFDGPRRTPSHCSGLTSCNTSRWPRRIRP